VPCARAFVEAGADWLGVALVEEGVELRRAGLLTPICVLSGMAGIDDAKVLVAHRLTPLIYRPDHLVAMAAAVRAAGLSRYAVHLKVDTGMGRWGALPQDVDAFLTALRRHPELELEGLATHFAGADEDDGAAVDRPLALFREMESLVRAKGRVRTRERLMSECRERDYGIFDRSIDVHISALRKKLGDDPKQPRFIRTYRGVGYMLVEPGSDE
jgi:alanine racemase